MRESHLTFSLNLQVVTWIYALNNGGGFSYSGSHL